MSGERLREMLSEATPGPWKVGGARYGVLVEYPQPDRGDTLWRILARVTSPYREEDARLIALAPDAIALLADMADHLGWLSDGASHELLLRLDALCGDER